MVLRSGLVGMIVIGLVAGGIIWDMGKEMRLLREKYATSLNIIVEQQNIVQQCDLVIGEAIKQLRICKKHQRTL